MARITPGSIEIALNADAEEIAAARSSFRSIFDALGSREVISENLAEAVRDAFGDGWPHSLGEIGPDVGNLLRIEMIDGPALGAHQVGVSIQPNGRYAELVAAICSDLDCRVELVSHGWPILSVGVRNTTVAADPVESIDRVDCPIHSDPTEPAAIGSIGSAPGAPPPLRQPSARALSEEAAS